VSSLVLASGSPRRRDLLAGLGLIFRVESADIDETPRPGESPRGYVKRLAREKAHAVARRLGDTSLLVLAADTSVILGEEILGKPRDAEHARQMLGRLCGQRHVVLTAVAAAGRHHDTRLVETAVTFRDATATEIAWYVDTGEPMDKAGAYAVQGRGSFLVSSLEGSPTNVIGLPLPETLQLLAAGGVVPPWGTSA
jgi:septum formation protein